MKCWKCIENNFLFVAEESGSVSESSAHLGESMVATHGSVEEENTPTESQEDEGGSQEPELRRRDLTGIALNLTTNNE